MVRVEVPVVIDEYELDPVLVVSSVVSSSVEVSVVSNEEIVDWLELVSSVDVKPPVEVDDEPKFVLEAVEVVVLVSDVVTCNVDVYAVELVEVEVNVMIVLVANEIVEVWPGELVIILDASVEFEIVTVVAIVVVVVVVVLLVSVLDE